MKKLLVSGALTALLVPGLALAAYNDVSLTTSTVLTVNGGITVNVTGTTAAVQSIVVGATTITFTLASGSSIELTAPSLNKLDTDTSANISTEVCNGSLSRLAYTGTATRTVIVTPSTALCVNSGGGGSANSGGGGGGGGGSSATSATPATPATPASATTPAVPATPATPATPPTIASLQAQLNALLAQLAALRGGATASASLSRNLQVGSTGADVKALQVYLNAHGYAVAASGAGSPGNETTRFGGATKAALIRLQKAAGISPAVGYFGAITRAYVNSHP